MWNLIVSLLILLLRTAALYSKCQPAKYLTVKQFKPSVQDQDSLLVKRRNDEKSKHFSPNQHPTAGQVVRK